MSLFLALMASVLLLLYILSHLTGITLGNGNNTSQGVPQRVLSILLKAVADFGFVAGAIYYLILYHSMMDGGF